MSGIYNRLYKNKAALNVLANSIENAKEVFEASEGHVIVGVLSKDYPNAGAAVEAMQAYGREIEDAVSIGLGAGDNRQGAVVAEIAKSYAGNHINQIFPAVGATRANLESQGKDSWINSLVSPSGKAGYVNISTGVYSAGVEDKAIVPIKAAIALVRDMGGNALKYFPMQGSSWKKSTGLWLKPAVRKASHWNRLAALIWTTSSRSSKSRWQRVCRKSFRMCIPPL